MAASQIQSREAGERVWGQVSRERTKWAFPRKEGAPFSLCLSPICPLGSRNLWGAGGIWLLG